MTMRQRIVSYQQKEFLTEFHIIQLDWLPYFPDFTPNDFFLFPKIMNHLKRHSVVSDADIKHNMIVTLINISEDFQNCLSWQHDWQIWKRCNPYFSLHTSNLVILLLWELLTYMSYTEAWHKEYLTVFYKRFTHRTLLA